MNSPLPVLAVVFGLFAAASAYATSPESIIVWHQEIGADRTGAGARVSALHAADPEKDAFTFALVAGAGDDDNANFSIAGNELRTTGSLTEGEYLIRLRATNPNEKSVEEAFVISVVPGKVVPKVAAGAWHTVVLASDGTVFGSGSGSRGQLGDGATEGRLLPVAIEDDALSEPVIVDVAAGGMHTVLLAADGSVFTFGWGLHGQLGHGNTESRLVPTRIEHDSLDGHTITRIGTGTRHTLLVAADGTVFTFGSASHGQLGHGDTSNRTVPAAIGHTNLAAATITGISGGGNHTVLLASDGTVFTFGQGTDNQLGHGDTANRVVPVPVEHENVTGRTITRVSAGGGHTILLGADGSVLTFGRGANGQLGHGDAESRSEPLPIEHESLAGRVIADIDAGAAHSALVSSSGEVLMFGSGAQGRLGHGGTGDDLSPGLAEHDNLTGRAIAGAALGTAHSVLLASDGTVFTFGWGMHGQLGHFDTLDRHVPTPVGFFRLKNHRMVVIEKSGAGEGSVLVEGEAVAGFPFLFQAEIGSEISIGAVPGAGSFLDRWLGAPGGSGTSRTLTLDEDKSITAVFGKTYLAVWNRTVGEESTGAGAGVSPLHAAGPAGDSFSFSLVSGEGDDHNTSFTVSGGELQTAGPLAAGDYSLRLRASSDDGLEIERAFTVSVVPGTVAPKVAAGNAHSVFLPSSGEVYTVGSAAHGRLGLGNTTDQLFPRRITAAAISGHTIVDVAAGSAHNLLLASDGTVFTFGSGSSGALGHGDTNDQSLPVPIEHENLDGYSIVGIAAGGTASILLASDGTVFTFGSGFAGRLGHGDTKNRDVPTPIESNNLAGHTITAIAAGAHSVLLSSEGQVFTFGAGGRLGHGDTENRLEPALIRHGNLDGHAVTGIAAGVFHTLLLSEDGTMFSFGFGGDGALGHGDTADRSVPTPIDRETISGFDITAIETGNRHSLALASDGSVFAWGRGQSGRLGHGDELYRDEPLLIEHESLDGRDITGFAAGDAHTVLHAADDTLLTFGAGGHGRLGHGTTESAAVPKAIETLDLSGRIGVRFAVSGAGSGMIRVNGNPVSEWPHYHLEEKGAEIVVEAVPDEGSFFERWMGDLSGADDSVTLTLDRIMSVTAGFKVESLMVWNPSIGEDRTGTGARVSTVHAVGPEESSFTYTLVPGDGDVDNSSFTVADDELRTTGPLSAGEYSVRLQASDQFGNIMERPVRIAVVPGMVAPKAAAGLRHSVFLSEDGTVYTFGSNANGQLGHGDHANREIPTAIEHENLAGHTIVDVAAGYNHTILLSLDGTVFTFGEGSFGRLGHGDTVSQNVPEPVAHENLSGRVATRVAAGERHTVLLVSDRTVFTFGSGVQLARGGRQSGSSPAAIDDDNLAGYSIIDVAAGHEHTVLLAADGTVFSAGRGWHGQLGTGNTDTVEVAGPIEHENLAGHVITNIAAGGRHTLLLSAGGMAFSFGWGESGQLGRGDRESLLVPMPVEHENLDGRTITGIEGGDLQSALLTDDGTVFTFGAGSFGVLGHGDTEDRLVPVPVEHENLAGERVTELALGGAGGRTNRFHSLFLTDGGTVFTAGTGDTGQLGHGDTQDRLEPEAIEFFRRSGYHMLRIAYSGDGIGSVVIDGDPLSEAPFLGQYETGSEILLEGIPGEDSVFAGWTGDLDESAAVWTLVLDADVELAAVFNLEERVRFEAAMAEAGLSGSEAGAAADPFRDGVPNLLKYAFNMDASGPDRRIVPSIPRSPTGEEAGLPKAYILHLDTGPVLRILFLRRRDSGLVYTPQTSTDLATWEAVTEEVGATEGGPGWEWAFVNLPLDGDSFFRFARVEVTLP